jgi:hypothetical protein
MTAQQLQTAHNNGTCKLPYDWNFYAEHNPDDDYLHGEMLRFYAGQGCVPIRLSQNRRALLVKITEQAINGQWTPVRDTAGGGIFRHWFSWLHAD